MSGISLRIKIQKVDGIPEVMRIVRAKRLSMFSNMPCVVRLAEIEVRVGIAQS
jgi:hypothetical protein